MAITKVTNDLQDALAASQPTITSVGTLTGFTSTGIDDNATSTAMTITSDEKVGIGINQPTEMLEIYNTSSPAIQLNDGGDYKSIMRLAGNDLEIRGSSGSLEFYTGSADGDSSTQRLTIDSSGHAIIGGGVTLGNGQTYAAANTLDDYEEGNWTPVVKSGATVIAITMNFAKYTKIGNTVYVTAYVTRADSASLSGTISIYGLPFTVLLGTVQVNGGCWFDTTGTDEVAANYFVGGSSYILGKKVGASSDYVTAGKFENTRPIYLSGSYIV
jgi:hypothetical protein